MRKLDLHNSTAEDLVALFRDIALAQSEAELGGEISKYNRLYGQMDLVEAELKVREGDQRRQLSSLYQHPNAQVRVKAAIRSLAVEPQAARQVLQIIVDRQEYPQAADARGILKSLDEGTHIPT